MKKKKKKKEEENYVPKAFKKDKEKNKDKVEKNNKHKKKGTKKKWRKGILVICVILIITLGVYLGISAQTWRKIAKDMIINENSIVVDIDGNSIAKLGCGRKNQKLTISNVPANLKNAYVAIEDQRFYSHSGIDVKRTGGAILNYIKHWANLLLVEAQ